MTTYSRNLPDGGGQPAPPPPPPDLPALEAAMYAACKTYQDAADALATLELDPAATFDAIYQAWDKAAAADMVQYRAAMAYRTARKWQGVRPA